MHELARVTLENEMDLILAHKRSMKLAELAGLSLSAQTTFATAVSEVSRNAIDGEKGGCLVLNVETEGKENYIVACLKDEEYDNARFSKGLDFAKRLVNRYKITEREGQTDIQLYYNISPAFRIDIAKVDEWRRLFRNEPPVSPYEEIKRKNEQLQELSQKVIKSEAQYKTLTNSLPMIIFSIDPNGYLLYANEWLSKFTGETVSSLNSTKWKQVVHSEDYDSFHELLSNQTTNDTTTLKIQARLKNKKGGNYLWHQVSLTPFKNEQEELQYWIGYIVDIHAQKVFEETLKDNIELKETQVLLKENQETLEKYIDELNRSNYELQQFAYVASHDLQEPVRKLIFYCDYLINMHASSLDKKGLEYLGNMQAASQRMRNLIQDLLSFSLITREQVVFDTIDLNEVMKEAVQDLEISILEKNAKLNVHPLPVIYGDQRMVRQLFENLISNSLKYSKPDVPPVIEISNQQNIDTIEIAFKDNGIGFDEQYLVQMFTLFQRLHNRNSYEGTGLGLAICRKIVEVHNGKIRANGKEGEGAIFTVSLPLNRDKKIK